MTRARWLVPVVLLALALAPAASAQTTGPCPPGSPAPVFTVNGSQSGPV